MEAGVGLEGLYERDAGLLAELVVPQAVFRKTKYNDVSIQFQIWQFPSKTNFKQKSGTKAPT